MLQSGCNATHVATTLGWTKEQSDAIQRLINGKDNYDRLGLHNGASRSVRIYAFAIFK